MTLVGSLLLKLSDKFYFPGQTLELRMKLDVVHLADACLRKGTGGHLFESSGHAFDLRLQMHVLADC